jgi:hypothetical protein
MFLSFVLILTALLLCNQSDPNVPPEPRILPPLTGLAAESYDKVKSLLDVSQAAKAVADADLRVIVERRNVQLETLLRLYQQRVSVNPGDARRFSTLPQVGLLAVLRCCYVGLIIPSYWFSSTLFMRSNLFC